MSSSRHGFPILPFIGPIIGGVASVVGSLLGDDEQRSSGPVMERASGPMDARAAGLYAHRVRRFKRRGRTVRSHLRRNPGYRGALRHRRRRVGRRRRSYRRRRHGVASELLRSGANYLV